MKQGLFALSIAALLLTFAPPTEACKFQIRFTNKTGKDLKIKDLKYKISSWEKLDFGKTFKVNNQKYKYKGVTNLIMPCKKGHRWKFTWKCNAPKAFNPKWRTDYIKVPKKKRKGLRTTTYVQLNKCFGNSKRITVRLP